MGEVIGINTPREEAAVEDIRAQLLAQGSASAVVQEIKVSPDAWRRAARSAARSLRRPVRTLEAGGMAHAVLIDWPRDEREQRIQERAVREAAAPVWSPAPRQ